MVEIQFYYICFGASWEKISVTVNRIIVKILIEFKCKQASIYTTDSFVDHHVSDLSLSLTLSVFAEHYTIYEKESIKYRSVRLSSVCFMYSVILHTLKHYLRTEQELMADSLYVSYKLLCVLLLLSLLKRMHAFTTHK